MLVLLLRVNIYKVIFAISHFPK